MSVTSAKIRTHIYDHINPGKITSNWDERRNLGKLETWLDLVSLLSRMIAATVSIAIYWAKINNLEQKDTEHKVGCLHRVLKGHAHR